MMLYPSVGELVKGDNKCRYSLVIAVAQKAREIEEEAEKSGEPLDGKPITLAVKSFADGKCSFRELPYEEENI